MANDFWKSLGDALGGALGGPAKQVIAQGVSSMLSKATSDFQAIDYLAGRMYEASHGIGTWNGKAPRGHPPIDPARTATPGRRAEYREMARVSFDVMAQMTRQTVAELMGANPGGHNAG